MSTRFKVSRFRVQRIQERHRVRAQRYKKAMSSELRTAVVFILVCLFCLSPITYHLSPAVAQAAEYSVAEAKIIHFIKEIYNDSDDIQVRLNTIPNQLKEKVKVKNITFTKFLMQTETVSAPLKSIPAPGGARTFKSHSGFL